jgi:hypothetical protein
MGDGNTALRIEWDRCRRGEWERLAAAAAACPFEQTWLYGDAYADGDRATVRRGVIFADDAPAAIVQGFTRRFARLMTLVQILRGPVLVAPAAAELLPALYRRVGTEMRRNRREVLFWTPELADGESASAAMRVCGLRQILTGYASARLDLTPNEATLRAALHGKWRNALTQVERAPLRVDAADLPWLLERYGALRRQRRFGGPGPAMLSRILSRAAPESVVALHATFGNEAVAGALFLTHGRGASYLVGWTDEPGRRLNAGTLLLWRGMLELRRRGIGSLDLGGIDTQRSPGIARFKLGVGGQAYRLAGTFA